MNSTDQWQRFEFDLRKIINTHEIGNRLNISNEALAHYMVMSCMDIWPLLNYKHYESLVALKAQKEESKND